MINIPSHFSFLPLISTTSFLFVFYFLSSSLFSSPSLFSHLLLLSFHLIDTVYKKITRVKEPKKKAESGMFVMKAPTAVVSGSGFAKPTSPTTNDSDSESPTPQPEAFEEPAPEEPPVGNEDDAQALQWYRLAVAKGFGQDPGIPASTYAARDAATQDEAAAQRLFQVLARGPDGQISPFITMAPYRDANGVVQGGPNVTRMWLYAPAQAQPAAQK